MGTRATLQVAGPAEGITAAASGAGMPPTRGLLAHRGYDRQWHDVATAKRVGLSRRARQGMHPEAQKFPQAASRCGTRKRECSACGRSFFLPVDSETHLLEQILLNPSNAVIGGHTLSRMLASRADIWACTCSRSVVPRYGGACGSKVKVEALHLFVLPCLTSCAGSILWTTVGKRSRQDSKCADDQKACMVSAMP